MILDRRLGMLGALAALLLLGLGAGLTHAAIDPGTALCTGNSTLVNDAFPAPTPPDPSSHRHEEAGKRRLRQMEPAATEPCDVTGGNLPQLAIVQVDPSGSASGLHSSRAGASRAWLPRPARLRLTLHLGQAP